MRRFKHALSLVFVLAGVAALGGCAAPASSVHMTVDDSAFNNAAAQTVFGGAIVLDSVDGGEPTNPAWMSEVGTPEFRTALEDSLFNTGLLARRSAPKYGLRASLIEVDQPYVGFNMTVTSTVRYALFDLQTRAQAYENAITASYTAGMSDSFLGYVRLKMANEGSIRKNIQMFIDDLIAHAQYGNTNVSQR